VSHEWRVPLRNDKGQREAGAKNGVPFRGGADLVSLFFVNAAANCNFKA